MTASAAPQLHPGTARSENVRWTNTASLITVSARVGYAAVVNGDGNSSISDDDFDLAVLYAKWASHVGQPLPAAHRKASSALNARKAWLEHRQIALTVCGGGDLLSCYPMASGWQLQGCVASSTQLTSLASINLNTNGTDTHGLLVDANHQAIEKQTPRSPALRALLARIRNFGGLAPDWAGEDTTAIDELTIAAAMRAAEAATRAEFPLPQASPSPEGEISLSWYRKRNRLALILAPDGYVTWTTSIDRHVEEGGELRIDSPFFPDSIVEALRGFYGQAAGAVSLRG